MMMPPVSPKSILPLSPLPTPTILSGLARGASTVEIGPLHSTPLSNGAAGYFVQLPNQSKSIVKVCLPISALVPGTTDLLMSVLQQGSESTKQTITQLRNQGINFTVSNPDNYTLSDRIVAEISGPAGQEAMLAQTLLKLLTQPIVDPASFNTEKSKTAKSYRGASSNPDGLLDTALKQRIYGPAHSFGLSLPDCMQIVEQQDLPSLMARYQQMIQAVSQAQVFMVSPLPVETQQKVLNNAIHGSGWFKQSYRPLPAMPPMPLPNPVGVYKPVLLGNNGLERALIQTIWKVPDMQDSDFPAYNLLTRLLQGMYDGSFQQKLRTEHGLIYGINQPEITKLAVGNGYKLGIEVDPDKIGPALQDIQQVTHAVCQNQLTPSMLHALKQQFLREYRTWQQDAQIIANVYSTWLEYDTPPPDLHRLQAAIERVTPMDIQRVANRVFNPATGAFQIMGISAPVPVLQKWFPGQPVTSV